MPNPSCRSASAPLVPHSRPVPDPAGPRARARRAGACRLLAAAALGWTASCGGGGGGGGGPQITLGSFQPGFALRQDVQLGLGDVGEAEVIDLNGDGLLDFVETDFLGFEVKTALGNPDGTFTPFFSLPTPGAPWRLATGDYNGDGRFDLVAACTDANGGTNSLALYEQAADGSFSPGPVALLDSAPIDVTRARFGAVPSDRVLVVLPDERETRAYARTAGGELQRVWTYPSSSALTHSPVSACAIDANADGRTDVIVGEVASDDGVADRITVHQAQVGGFAAPSVLAPIAAYPLVDNVGDATGDGQEDLGVAQLAGGRALLFAAGPGGLTPPIEVDFGGTTSSILFADLDGDGIEDAAATLLEQDAVGVRLATGPLAWGPLSLYNVGELPRALQLARFGLDDEPDLFCANVRDVSILHGTGGGQFRGARGFTVGDEPQFVRCVDLDEDGFVDAVCVDQFQKKVVFMRGQGDGTFVNVGQVPLTPSQVETAGFLLIDDFDANGLLDVVTTVNEAGEVQLMRNVGSLPFTGPQAGDTVPVGADPLGFDAADVDGDGVLDIVVANSGENSFQVLLGRGTGGFATAAPIATPYRPLVVLVEELDGDGHLDVAVSTGEIDGTDTFLLLYAGDGAGGFAPAATLPLTTTGAVLHSGDFDEDGLADLVVSQTGVHSNRVHVLLNRGTFAFQQGSLEVGFRPGTLEIADIDLDGHLDLVVPLGTGQLRLALGDGSGGFPELVPPLGEQFPVPHGSTASAFADVDGDGLPDLVLTSPDNPHLWVSLNDGSLVGADAEE